MVQELRGLEVFIISPKKSENFQSTIAEECQHSSPDGRSTVVKKIDKVAEVISQPHHSGEGTMKVIITPRVTPAEQIYANPPDFLTETIL
ncbi:hypothetical protein J6590_004461 [Homalodisca vitripennis]|nr:hypothetical protein J6590_004461 [Homalodisca vitripennis]